MSMTETLVALTMAVLSALTAYGASRSHGHRKRIEVLEDQVKNLEDRLWRCYDEVKKWASPTRSRRSKPR